MIHTVFAGDGLLYSVFPPQQQLKHPLLTSLLFLVIPTPLGPYRQTHDPNVIDLVIIDLAPEL